MNEDLISRLRAGDEAAFSLLVGEYQGRLVRLARSFSRNESVIEEAVQETWLAVIRGIGRFEGRGSLQSWLFSILVNQTRRLASKEKRHDETGNPGTPNPNLTAEPRGDPDEDEPGLNVRGRWEAPPVPWGLEDPESFLLREETLTVIQKALSTMPEGQRQVVLLCDVEGVSPEEACNILGVSGTNQRVLLHRARARIRRALDAYLGAKPTGESGPKRRGG
ncbi:MAG: sigma-70 family RNA polymerase sigma factor [candidate division NC10 bacterium]|nr:sigma-70 family RNA polymerase sigma factor [candidate division NC10 bacterium]